MDTELAAHSLDAGHDEAAAVLAKTIPWDALLTSNVLTDRDVQMIRRFDKRDKFTQAALWEKARLPQPAAPGALLCSRSAVAAPVVVCFARHPPLTLLRPAGRREPRTQPSS